MTDSKKFFNLNSRNVKITEEMVAYIFAQMTCEMVVINNESVITFLENIFLYPMTMQLDKAIELLFI